mmetsp:Transcript_12804/g.30649  ORF Transcript_12804/g.30649 Transcript_12804/m.30649 type:complete len:321 (+) Transcript_12804:1498-2460(+)
MNRIRGQFPSDWSQGHIVGEERVRRRKENTPLLRLGFRFLLGVGLGTRLPPPPGCVAQRPLRVLCLVPLLHLVTCVRSTAVCDEHQAVIHAQALDDLLALSWVELEAAAVAGQHVVAGQILHVPCHALAVVHGSGHGLELEVQVCHDLPLPVVNFRNALGLQNLNVSEKQLTDLLDGLGLDSLLGELDVNAEQVPTTSVDPGTSRELQSQPSLLQLLKQRPLAFVAEQVSNDIAGLRPPPRCHLRQDELEESVAESGADRENADVRRQLIIAERRGAPAALRPGRNLNVVVGDVREVLHNQVPQLLKGIGGQDGDLHDVR